MRTRWWVAGIGVLVIGAGAGVGVWILTRGPAPAPTGALASVEAARLALVERAMPEGEAGAHVLDEADRLRESVLDGWPLSWRRAEHSIASGAAYGPWHDPRVAPTLTLREQMGPAVSRALEIRDRPRAFVTAHEALGAPAPVDPFDSSSWIESRIAPELESWLHAELVHAMIDDDGARAADALDALLHLASYYAQRPGLGGAHIALIETMVALDMVAMGVRDGALSPATCGALIDVIRDHGVWDAIASPLHIEGERLWAQRQALLLRSHFRSIGAAGRIEARALNRLAASDAFVEMPDAGWLRVLTEYDAAEVEAQIDAYFEAVEAWWGMPPANRPATPSAPGPASEGPWAVLPSMYWAAVRFSLDLLLTHRAGALLLLLIETYEAEHGAPPRSLAEVASEAERIDPVVGRPFRYSPEPSEAHPGWPYDLRTGVTAEELAERGMFLDTDTAMAREMAEQTGDAEMEEAAASATENEMHVSTWVTCAVDGLEEEQIIDLPWVDRRGRLIEGAAPGGEDEGK